MRDETMCEKQVKDLNPGDLIDLEGDPYADPNSDILAFKYEYAMVDAIDHETGNCTAVWILGVDCFGFPPAHTVFCAGEAWPAMRNPSFESLPSFEPFRRSRIRKPATNTKPRHRRPWQHARLVETYAF